MASSQLYHSRLTPMLLSDPKPMVLEATDSLTLVQEPLEDIIEQTGFRPLKYRLPLSSPLSNIDFHNNEEDRVVNLKIESKIIPVDKEILIRRSDYFRAMFNSGMKESRQTEIEIVGIAIDSMESILQFLNQGELMLQSDKVHLLLDAAQQLQIAMVSDACEDYLGRILIKDNLIEILDLADHYNLEKLLQSIYQILRKDFNNLVLSGCVEKLKFDQIVALLECDKPISAKEHEIFFACVQWSNVEDPPSPDIVHQYDELIKFIKFPLMTLDVLSKLNKTKPCWYKTEQFKAMMLEAIAYRNKMYQQPLLQTGRTVLRGTKRHLVSFTDDDSILSADNSLKCHCLCLEQGFSPENEMNFVLKDLKLDFHRDGYAVVVWNNFLYVAGGYQPETEVNLSAVHRYDPMLQAWASVHSMMYRRASFYVGVLGDNLVAVGGRKYDFIGGSHVYKPLDSVECYDCVKDNWTKAKSSLPTGLYYHAGVSHNGKVYITGGRCDISVNAIRDTNIFLSFDLESDHWSDLPSMLFHRYNHGMASDRDKIFVFGGSSYDNSQGPPLFTFVCDMEYYDFTSGQWTVLAPLPRRRTQMGVVLSSDIIYVVGGLPFPGVDGRREVLEYAIKANEWKISNIKFHTYWPTTSCILSFPYDNSLTT